MTRRKDYGTLLLWGLAVHSVGARRFATHCGVFETQRAAREKAAALNDPYALHVYEPVRVTLSWERPVKRGRRSCA
ncbi:MAG: hypothetical protein IT178_16400 [Acidobacteria bacterium]|nr:hypothetical protein [Acidobacteriota bacterium]